MICALLGILVTGLVLRQFSFFVLSNCGTAFLKLVDPELAGPKN